MKLVVVNTFSQNLANPPGSVAIHYWLNHSHHVGPHYANDPDYVYVVYPTCGNSMQQRVKGRNGNVAHYRNIHSADIHAVARQAINESPEYSENTTELRVVNK